MAATALRDTYTNSISAHKPDLGPTFTIYGGTGSISGGVLTSITSGVALRAASNVGEANRCVAIDDVIPSGNYASELLFRMTDANNGYMLLATKIGAQPHLRLIKLGGLI